MSPTASFEIKPPLSPPLPNSFDRQQRSSLTPLSKSLFKAVVLQTRYENITHDIGIKVGNPRLHTTL